MDQSTPPQAILSIAFSVVTPSHGGENNIKIDLN